MPFFLINPGQRRKDAPMAKRKRSRRNPRGRGGRFVKRRNPSAFGTTLNTIPNRPRRRGARHNPPRRHAIRRRRNPPSAINAIMEGLINGGMVYVGGLATRKFAGAVSGMLPASSSGGVSAPSGAAAVALRLGGAVVIALVSSKILPKQAEMLTAGAFAETISNALAQTPIAPYLGAHPPRRFIAALTPMRPGQRGVGMRAWTQVAPTQRSLPRGGQMRGYPGQRVPINMPQNSG